MNAIDRALVRAANARQPNAADLAFRASSNDGCQRCSQGDHCWTSVAGSFRLCHCLGCPTLVIPGRREERAS